MKWHEWTIFWLCAFSCPHRPIKVTCPCPQFLFPTNTQSGIGRKIFLKMAAGSMVGCYFKEKPRSDTSPYYKLPKKRFSDDVASVVFPEVMSHCYQKLPPHVLSWVSLCNSASVNENPLRKGITYLMQLLFRHNHGQRKERGSNALWCKESEYYNRKGTEGSKLGQELQRSRGISSGLEK